MLELIVNGPLRCLGLCLVEFWTVFCGFLSVLVNFYDLERRGDASSLRGGASMYRGGTSMLRGGASAPLGGASSGF